MENVLLRRLTFKSQIKFGYHKDLLVMDLYKLAKYKELISMYYNLEKIDFDDEVKNALCITGDRVLSKPCKDEQFYIANKSIILKEIWDKHTLATKGFDYTIQANKKSVLDAKKRSANRKVNAVCSPMRNKMRNQKA